MIRARWSRWSSAAFTINPIVARAVALPVPKDDALTGVAGRPLAVAAPGMLGDDTHLRLTKSGVRLTAQLVSGPTHGKLDLRPDGAFTHIPGPGFPGTDSFRYRAHGGRGDSTLVATGDLTVGSGPAAPAAPSRSTL